MIVHMEPNKFLKRLWYLICKNTPLFKQYTINAELNSQVSDLLLEIEKLRAQVIKETPPAYCGNNVRCYLLLRQQNEELRQQVHQSEQVIDFMAAYAVEAKRDQI